MSIIDDLRRDLALESAVLAPTNSTPIPVTDGIPAIWKQALVDLDEATMINSATSLGIPIETLRAEHAAGRLGAYEGRIAFPVQQDADVIGLHVYSARDKAFAVPTQSLEPLVYPSPVAIDLASTVHVVPSPFAYLLITSQVDLLDGAAVIACRGENKSQIGELLRPGQQVYLWTEDTHDRTYKEILAKITGCDVYQVVVKERNFAEALAEAVRVKQAPAIDPNRDERFPLDVLPPLARSVVQEFVRVFGCNPLMPFFSIIGTVSGLSFARVRANYGRGEYAHSNIFVVVLSPTASGKTLIGGRIGAPAVRYNAFLIEEHQKELDGIKARERLLTKERDHILSRIAREADKNFRPPAGKSSAASAGQVISSETPGCEPRFADRDDEMRLERIEHELARLERDKITPSFIVDELSSEALEIKLSKASSEYVYSYSTDARKAASITLSGRYQKKGDTDDGLLIKCFEGDSHASERVTRDAVVLKMPRMALLWFLQPDLADKILREETVHSGSIARFFVTRLQALKSRAKARVVLDPQILGRWDRFATTIAKKFHSMAVNGAYLTLTISKEVQQVMIDFENRLIDEGLETTNLAGAEPFAARWHEKGMRLALLFHLMEREKDFTNPDPSSASDERNTMSVETARAAIAMIEHLAAEELRSLTAYRFDAEDKDHKKVMHRLEIRGAATMRELFLATGIAQASIRVVLDRAIERGLVIATKGPKTTRFRASGSAT